MRTSVRDSSRKPSSRTPRPGSGVNRKRAVPSVRGPDEHNTNHSVETNGARRFAGAVQNGLSVPLAMPCCDGCSRFRQSRRPPGCRPPAPDLLAHHVDGFAHQRHDISETRIDKGMDTHTISVLRQLPRNSRIIMPVRQRPAALPALLP